MSDDSRFHLLRRPSFAARKARPKKTRGAKKVAKKGQRQSATRTVKKRVARKKRQPTKTTKKKRVARKTAGKKRQPAKKKVAKKSAKSQRRKTGAKKARKVTKAAKKTAKRPAKKKRAARAVPSKPRKSRTKTTKKKRVARKTAGKKRQPAKKKVAKKSAKSQRRKTGAKKARKVTKAAKKTAKRPAKKKRAARAVPSKPRKSRKKLHPKTKRDAKKPRKVTKPVRRKTAGTEKRRRKVSKHVPKVPRKKKKRVAAAKHPLLTVRTHRDHGKREAWVRGEILTDKRSVRKVHERGEVVSPKAFTPPGQVRVPHVLGPNIYYVDINKFDDFSEEDDGEEVERYMTSTSGMHMHNDNYLALFRQAFYDYMKKTRFEDVDDIPIYRYGLLFRSVKPRGAEAVTKMIYQIAEFLKDMLPRGASAHIVDEGRYISVRLGLGRYRQPTTFARAYDYMARNRELIHNFKRGILDYLEDAIWFAFWDTEENYAES